MTRLRILGALALLMLGIGVVSPLIAASAIAQPTQPETDGGDSPPSSDGK